MLTAVWKVILLRIKFESYFFLIFGNALVDQVGNSLLTVPLCIGANHKHQILKFLAPVLFALTGPVEQPLLERPTLLSLRDSGELEQNGSKVLFLWKIDEFGTVGVSVAKNRRGRQGVVQMHFDGEHQRFIELSEPYQEPKKKSRRGGFLEGGT